MHDWSTYYNHHRFDENDESERDLRVYCYRQSLDRRLRERGRWGSGMCWSSAYCIWHAVTSIWSDGRTPPRHATAHLSPYIRSRYNHSPTVHWPSSLGRSLEDHQHSIDCPSLFDSLRTRERGREEESLLSICTCMIGEMNRIDGIHFESIQLESIASVSLFSCSSPEITWRMKVAHLFPTKPCTTWLWMDSTRGSRWAFFGMLKAQNELSSLM